MNNPRIILDSGAYTVFKQGSTIDIDEYAEFVKNSNSVFCDYFNLDVIGDCVTSYKQWVYLRSLGLNPIPVFHLGGDETYLLKYLKQTDYIAIGAVAGKSTPQRLLALDYLWNKYFINSSGEPLYKIHGLGMTSIDLIKRYPWYSVDSTSILFTGIYGKIYLPLWRNNQWDYLNGIFCYVSLGEHNTNAGVSFLSLSKFLQEKYMELFTQLGFSLGQMMYVEKRQTRVEKKSKDTRLSPFSSFSQDLIKNEVNKNKLNSCNIQRLMYNLTMYNKLKENLQKPCIIYLATGESFIATAFQFITPRHDLLFSYAYLKSSNNYRILLELYKANKPIP